MNDFEITPTINVLCLSPLAGVPDLLQRCLHVQIVVLQELCQPHVVGEDLVEVMRVKSASCNGKEQNN